MLEQEHGDGSVEMEHGDRSKGMILWGWEHGDGSVGMGEWDESLETTAWGRELLSVILFSDYFECFFDKMISFLTLAWKNGDGNHGDGSLFLVFCFQTIMKIF